ncbi:MAG: hypothetical protein KDK78_03630 [Chlamydiia bacterium]|nr:hypothetical protein [Chlamydiia bacterium]
MNEAQDLPEISEEDALSIETVEVLIDRLEDPVLMGSARGIPELLLWICSGAGSYSPMIRYQILHFSKALSSIAGGDALSTFMEIWTHIGQALLSHPEDEASCLQFLNLSETESSRQILRAGTYAAAEAQGEEGIVASAWKVPFQRAMYLRRLMLSFGIFESRIFHTLAETLRLQKEGKVRFRPEILGYRTTGGACKDGMVWLRLYNTPGETGKKLEIAINLAAATGELLVPFFALLSAQAEAREVLQQVSGLAVHVTTEQKGATLWTSVLEVEGLGRAQVSYVAAQPGQIPLPKHLLVVPYEAPTPAQQKLPTEAQLQACHKLLALLGLSHVLVPMNEEETPKQS